MAADGSGTADEDNVAATKKASEAGLFDIPFAVREAQYRYQYLAMTGPPQR